jgi:hypothetical protein
MEMQRRVVVPPTVLPPARARPDRRVWLSSLDFVSGAFPPVNQAHVDFSGERLVGGHKEELEVERVSIRLHGFGGVHASIYYCSVR